MVFPSLLPPAREVLCVTCERRFWSFLLSPQFSRNQNLRSQGNASYAGFVFPRTRTTPRLISVVFLSKTLSFTVPLLTLEQGTLNRKTQVLVSQGNLTNPTTITQCSIQEDYTSTSVLSGCLEGTLSRLVIEFFIFLFLQYIGKCHRIHE